MTILHIIVGLNVGGAEKMLQRLVETHVGKSAYRHVVPSLIGKGTRGTQLQPKDVEVHSLGMRSAFGIALVAGRLVRLIRAIWADLVQSWMFYADSLRGLAARMAVIGL